jgi:rhodanese-related sulfurtransferase
MLLLAGFGAPGCAQSDDGSLSWKAVDALIENDFPDVRSVSTDELSRWLADSTRERPLLLDAREPAEYAVSHLPGAVQVDPAADAALLADRFSVVDPARPVVVYCSVGYRSARLAEALERAGFSRVQNLDGSIFRWANEGRPVVREVEGEEVEAEEVHPFDATWGRLLTPELRAD